jgi:hypothetical protein
VVRVIESPKTTVFRVQMVGKQELCKNCIMGKTQYKRLQRTRTDIVCLCFKLMMSFKKIEDGLGLTLKIVALLGIIAFAPAAVNELNWLYKGKKSECLRLKSEYEQLVASSARLNTRAFSPGDGTAINQVFLGGVLSSSTQSPNAKLIQATIYGCGTSGYPLLMTSW